MNCPAHQFPARLSSLREALTYVAAICTQAGLKKNEQLRVELVIEELFTNTVCHGYGDDCDDPVWIAANVSNENLCITYQDAAPAYNPLTRPTNRIPSAIGGLGVTLVKHFAQARYFHENGRNTLILTFQLSSD
jgi:anti-sigma regulatory factor (Ser/Thr protein kinase)